MLRAASFLGKSHPTAGLGAFERLRVFEQVTGKVASSQERVRTVGTTVGVRGRWSGSAGVEIQVWEEIEIREVEEIGVIVHGVEVEIGIEVKVVQVAQVVEDIMIEVGGRS